MARLFTPAVDLLQKAENGGYAVGAFNFSNMEIMHSIIWAAEAEKAPVILQVSQGAINYAGLEYLVGMARAAAKKTSVPFALHLDHGTDKNLVMECVEAGFSSIMCDCSRFPLQQNIALTKEVVGICRKAGVSVEAELGRISGTEDSLSVTEKEAFFTDPEEARIFVEETGVDSLAVAIGTAHGLYVGEPKLDFDRLAKIRAVLRVPIVLHGSSGVPDGAIQRAIRLGVRKINIDTDIRQTFVGAVRRVLAEDPAQIDPRKIFGPARQASVETIRRKISLFGSTGRAFEG